MNITRISESHWRLWPQTYIDQNLTAIACHGKMELTKNIHIVGDTNQGDEFEQIHCDGFNTWEECVNTLIRKYDFVVINQLEAI